MANIVFFNNNLIGLCKYAASIQEQIEKLSPGNKYLFIYTEEDADERGKFLDLSLRSNSELLYLRNKSYKSICSIFTSFNADHLVVFAQRITDSALVSVAKSLDVGTTMFQHGIYIPFMKREASLFLEKYRKALDYANLTSVIAYASKGSRFQYLKDYMDIFIRGKNVLDTSINTKGINVDTVLVYGEYWKQYHRENFGYSSNEQKIVGYQDMEERKDILSQTRREGICYIAQTLVEDSRLDRASLLKFINQLSNALTPGTEVYIKLHPRSDVSLYQELVSQHGAKLCRDQIPYCTHYLGHYSTLIAAIASVTSNILLWEFPEHPIPEYFTQNCLVTTDQKSILANFLNSQLSSDLEIDISKFSKYFYFDSVGTYQKIAQHVVNELGCQYPLKI